MTRIKTLLIFRRLQRKARKLSDLTNSYCSINIVFDSFASGRDNIEVNLWIGKEEKTFHFSSLKNLFDFVSLYKEEEE